MKHHLIITVHGIRTYGRWQQHLEKLIHQNEKNHSIKFHFLHYNYGFFTIFSFFIPLLRNLAVQKFKKHLDSMINKDDYQRIDIIAHSFGTYIVSKALEAVDDIEEKLIHTLIFAGSVLSPDYDLTRLLGPKKPAQRLINDCGVNDHVLLLTFLVYGTGMGGRLGLHGFEGSKFLNRYFNLGHSGYFEPKSDPKATDFVERWWLPIIFKDQEIEGRDDRPERPAIPDRILRTLGENSSYVMIGLYLTVFVSIGLPISALIHKAQIEKQVAEQADIARRLAREAQEIVVGSPEKFEISALLVAESLTRSRTLA